MFYRYAYLIILASITFALVLARLSYTVTLQMTHAVVPTTEIARVISILDLPPPRSVEMQGRNVVLHFNPFISSSKKRAFESLIQQLDNSQNQGRSLGFNVYLNEPSPDLFNYMLHAMGNQRNIKFTLNTDKATMHLIPYAVGAHEQFQCNWEVDVTPALPNFRVVKSTLTHNPDDDNTQVQVKYTLSPDNPEHAPLTPLMRLDSSQTIAFVVDQSITPPPQVKNNLLVVQRLCNEALLKQGNAMLDYILFPVLTSELRGASFDYDLSNDILKL